MSRNRDRDLRDEVALHIELRTERHIKDGLTPDAAAMLARKQFGDTEAIMNEMRRARLTSPKLASFAVASVSLIAVAAWMYVGILPGAAVVLPELPRVPVTLEKRIPPPPPPRPPTWEEFVKKVNTFGERNAKATRR